MVVSSGGQGADQALCVLENLCLAGNRIGDVGAAALGALLERREEERQVSEERRLDQQGGNVVEQPPSAPSHGSPRYLGWLSVAGNPGISVDGRERLLRAGGSDRRRPCRADENDPSPMVVVIA